LTSYDVARSVRDLVSEAVHHYVDDWTLAITDVTSTATAIHHLLRNDDEPAATALIPAERSYPLPARIGTLINATLA